jgi:hypothetical protein
MKNKYHFIISVGIVLLLTKCDQMDTRFLVINRSNASLYYCILYANKVTYKDVHQLPGIKHNSIPKGDSIRPFIIWKGDNWNYMVKKYSPDNRVHLFFFIADTVQKYGWDKILQLKKYDRKDFTVAQLDSLNWVYVYSENK